MSPWCCKAAARWAPTRPASIRPCTRRGCEPDGITGVSIGAINGAIIAGNPPERRLQRLHAFWDLVTARPDWGFPPHDDAAHRAHDIFSSLLTLALGQPGFFTPRVPNPWFAPRGSDGATSFYDSTPLRETLLRLVDFDLLNRRHVRFACGAVNVAGGDSHLFRQLGRRRSPRARHGQWRRCRRRCR